MKNDNLTILALSAALVGSVAIAQPVPPALPGPYQPMFQSQFPTVMQPVEQPAQQQTVWPPSQSQGQQVPYWMQQPQAPANVVLAPPTRQATPVQTPVTPPVNQGANGYNGQARSQFYNGFNMGGGGYGYGPAQVWNNGPAYGRAPATGGYPGYAPNQQQQQFQGNNAVQGQQAPYQGNAWGSPWGNPYNYAPAFPMWGYPQQPYYQPGYPAQGGWR